MFNLTPARCLTAFIRRNSVVIPVAAGAVTPAPAPGVETQGGGFGWSIGSCAMEPIESSVLGQLECKITNTATYILNIQYEGCQWQYGLQYRYIEKIGYAFFVIPRSQSNPHHVSYTQLVPIVENFGM